MTTRMVWTTKKKTFKTWVTRSETPPRCSQPITNTTAGAPPTQHQQDATKTRGHLVSAWIHLRHHLGTTESEAPPGHHTETPSKPHDTMETPSRRHETTKTSPRHHQNTRETPERHQRDTRETPERHQRDTTKIATEAPPRYDRDRDTPPSPATRNPTAPVRL